MNRNEMEPVREIRRSPSALFDTYIASTTRIAIDPPRSGHCRVFFNDLEVSGAELLDQLDTETYT